MNVASEPIAFFEHALAALFAPIEVDEPAVMQGEHRLPGDRLDQHDPPPLTLRLRAATAAHGHPAKIARAEQERRGKTAPHSAVTELPNDSGRRESSASYSIVWIQPGANPNRWPAMLSQGTGRRVAGRGAPPRFLTA